MSGTKAAKAPAPAAEPASLADVVHDARERLARAARVGEMRGDPLCDVLEAISVSLGAQLRLHEAGAERAALPLDPAALVRLEGAAATGAAKRAAELARAHTRRTALLYAGGALLCMALAGAGGFFLGRTSVQHTERRIAAAFQDGAEAAEGWAILMENNDLKHALDLCTGNRAYADQSGRKVCLVPLYVEPPRRAAPAEERRR